MNSKQKHFEFTSLTDYKIPDHMTWSIEMNRLSEIRNKKKEQESKEYDFVNPDHYKQGGKETIDMMVDIWGAEAVSVHCEITAFKYMQRLGKKPDNPIKQDLDKALWYLNKAKELRNG